MDNPALNVTGLSAGYGKRVVLHEVTVDAQPGVVTALVGANGSGKSTLLRAIAGIADVFAGIIALGPARLDAHIDVIGRIRDHHIAVVPQRDSVFPELTVDEHVRLGASLLPRAERAASIDRAYGTFERLWELRHRRARALSGGEKQMVALACALMRVPAILLLDEPTTGLSRLLARLFLSTVRDYAVRENAVVVVVEHSLGELQQTARAVHILRRGRVSYSGNSEILGRKSELAQYFL